MSRERRRTSDRRRARVFKATGLTMLAAGCSLPVVTFLGYTVLWIIEIVRALNGLAAVELPGPPWDTWEAIVAAAALTLVGGFFYTSTDTSSGGSLVRGIVKIVLRDGGRADVHVENPVEEEEPAT